MLRTFNMGVGMTLIVAPDALETVRKHLFTMGCDNNPIGTIVPGEKRVVYQNGVKW